MKPPSQNRGGKGSPPRRPDQKSGQRDSGPRDASPRDASPRDAGARPPTGGRAAYAPATRNTGAHGKPAYGKVFPARTGPDRGEAQRGGAAKPSYGKPSHGSPSHGAPAPDVRPPSPARSRPDGKPPLSLTRPVTAAPPRPRPQARERPDSSSRAAETPRGSVWLYGLHAVAAALANRHRRLRRLLLTDEAQVALAARLSPPWPLTPEPTDRYRLDTLLGRDVVHQGIALLADPLSPPTLAQVLERPGPILVLDQVNDPRNVGAILRSAAAFGAAAVITQDRNAPDETGALAKAASGALESVPLLRAVNIARTLIALKAAGCWTIGLDSDGKPLSGVALAGRRVALVLGSEGEGMRRLTRETCDELAGIAMAGRDGALDSLNVSAAAAVALYELGRTP